MGQYRFIELFIFIYESPALGPQEMIGPTKTIAGEKSGPVVFIILGAQPHMH